MEYRGDGVSNNIIRTPYWLSQRKRLTTKLHGVNGYTGRGKLGVSAWGSGASVLNIELRGVAGREAEICVDGDRLHSVPLTNGKAARRFHATKERDNREWTSGAKIEIRQNGQAILQGVLRKGEKPVKRLIKFRDWIFARLA